MYAGALPRYASGNCPIGFRGHRTWSGLACSKCEETECDQREQRSGEKRGAREVDSRTIPTEPVKQLGVPSENLIRHLSGRATLVPMVQSANLWKCDDLSKFSLVCHPGIGRVLLECEMRP